MSPSAPLPLASPSKRKRLPEVSESSRKRNILPKAASTCSKPSLQIFTDLTSVSFNSPSLDHIISATDSDVDSLFDEVPPQPFTPDLEDLNRDPLPSIIDEEPPSLEDSAAVPASRTAPSIPGLYFDPSIILSDDLADDLMWTCIRTFFREGSTNQVMLFERATPPDAPQDTPNPSGLPEYLRNLISLLESLLRPAVPPDIHNLLFSPTPLSHTGRPRARQAIINLYWPGEGITPHVDLLDRYGDGIIGVSLGSGCVMRFDKTPDAPSVAPEDARGLYLPKGSVLVMTKDARYCWTHGIEKRYDDLVEESPGSHHGVKVDRDVRLSITFRWLLPGADVVGPSA